MDFSSPNWFSFSCPAFFLPFTVKGTRSSVWLWSFFRRAPDRYGMVNWGIGVLQIGSRHLFYMGRSADEGALVMSVLFTRRMMLRRATHTP